MENFKYSQSLIRRVITAMVKKGKTGDEILEYCIKATSKDFGYFVKVSLEMLDELNQDC